MTPNTPLISRLALEAWRSSGKRTLPRLHNLVVAYAATRAGESENVAYYQSAAVAAVREWEVERETVEG